MANSKASKTTAPALGLAFPITNRKPDGSVDFSGWFLMAPYGEHPHADSGFVQVIDEIAVDAMVNAFKEGEELLCDFEHDSHNPDKPTKAAGWTVELRKGEGGLEARNRWSGSGKTALSNEDYRFISPVWLARDCQVISENRIRPLRLNDSGLTNTPNLRNMPSISNRDLTAAIQSHAGEEEKTATETETQNQEINMLKKLVNALSLAGDATEEAVITAVVALVNKTKELGEQNTALTNSNRTLLEAAVDSDLLTAGITDEEEKKTWRPQLLANREGTLPLLASLTKNRGEQAAKTLTNRGGAQTPGATEEKKTETKDIGRQQADAIATELSLLPNRTAPGANEQAYQNAKRKHPALFNPQPAATE
jgi:phage I-like protein